MAEKVSYKALRDQLVSLSVDIDDKAKVCTALQRKIDAERVALGAVEEDVAESFQLVMEVVYPCNESPAYCVLGISSDIFHFSCIV